MLPSRILRPARRIGSTGIGASRFCGACGYGIMAIAHPSKKGILLRISPKRRPQEALDPMHGPVSPSFIVWFADGHGAIHREQALRPGVPLRIWLPDGEPVLTTERGLLGRDVR